MSALNKDNICYKTLTAILQPEQATQIKKLEEFVDDELEYYIKSPTIDLEKNPLLWWNDHTKEFPNLCYIAEKYLILPGTSVPSERVFSCAGNLITDTRVCLSAEHAEQLIFLAMNKHIC